VQLRGSSEALRRRWRAVAAAPPAKLDPLAYIFVPNLIKAFFDTLDSITYANNNKINNGGVGGDGKSKSKQKRLSKHERRGEISVFVCFV
jgi:hypothetical protein